MQELKKDLLKVAKPVLFNTEMVRAILESRKTVTRRICKDANKCTEPDMSFYDADKRTYAVHNYADANHTDKLSIVERKCPICPGDILYVRETWQYLYELDGNEQIIEGTGRYYYAATDTIPFDTYVDSMGVTHDRVPWCPSIHMPKDAARIFLMVKDVRVERLQDITEEQAKAEGICRLYDDMSKEEYEAWARKVGKMEPQEECSFKNYLWHGNFGSCGCGNKLSDAWEYQFSGYDSAVSSFSSLWNTTVELKDWNQYGWDANPWVWVIEFERIEPESEVWLCRNLLRN